ncbi:hypothetical protein AABD39_13790, partial [Staphylococcus nepalensis]
SSQNQDYSLVHKFGHKPNMQTDSRSIGTQSSSTEQLEKRRIERAQKTKQANSKVFGGDTRESENERERTRSNHIKIERDDEGLSR